MLLPVESTSVASWYKKLAQMINSDYPWAGHGGGYAGGINCGIFTFGVNNGSNENYRTFRIVLTP